MSKTINTVLGPIEAKDLGRTLMHEHLIYGFCGFQGDSTLGPFDELLCMKENMKWIKPIIIFACSGPIVPSSVCVIIVPPVSAFTLAAAFKNVSSIGVICPALVAIFITPALMPVLPIPLVISVFII